MRVYRDYVDHGLDFARRHSDISILIRYEELVADPRRVLCELLGRIGEEFEPAMLTGFYHRSRQEGIEDPKVKGTRSIHAESVGRWRRDLGPDEVRLAARELGPLARTLGYDLGETAARDP
ncbi:MAG: hypothetical protein ACREQY_06855 [Candidatus Binatia bacterium]